VKSHPVPHRGCNATLAAHGVLLLYLGALLLFPPCAIAQSSVETNVFNPFSSRDPLAETGRESDHLTGDWGGWRTKMLERGFHFQLGYIAETMANVSGGLRRGGSYNGLVKAAIEVDTELATGGWRGGNFFASALALHGDSLSAKRVGDATALSNLDAYDSVRLYELWLEQSVWQNRLSLRVGQLLADEEFAFTEYGGLFLNSAFGWPHFISANTVNTGPAFFATALGARLKLEPCEHFYLQAGLYDGDTFDDPLGGDPRKNAHGTRFHLSGDQGSFSLYEAGLKWNQGEHVKGLPGSFKFGGWHHSGVPATGVQSLHGLYLATEQLVWREADDSAQGLGVFFRAGGSPSNRSAFNLAVDGGLHYQGLLPARDNDVTGLAVAYVRVSDSVRAAALAGGVTPLPDREMVIEFDYQAQIKPWCTVQPCVQWILHPGGSDAIADAVIVGLRTNLTF
jgi:porin